jgi:hypothetical protein
VGVVVARSMLPTLARTRWPRDLLQASQQGRRPQQRQTIAYIDDRPPETLERQGSNGNRHIQAPLVQIKPERRQRWLAWRQRCSKQPPPNIRTSRRSRSGPARPRSGPTSQAPAITKTTSAGIGEQRAMRLHRRTCPRSWPSRSRLGTELHAW